MRRKKKGSSLVTVVIIFAMLIIFGTAMLSMTTGQYKLRIKESKRIENLYGSESGLDVAYNIIIKTFDAAATYADNCAERFKANKIAEIRKQNEDNKKADPKAIMKAEEVPYTDINNTFQDAFRAFINPVKPIDDKFTTRCQDELRRAIFNNQYIESIQDDGAGSFKIADAAVTFSGDKPEMRIDLNDGIQLDSLKKHYSIKIVSSFTSKSTTGDNLRKIGASYNLTVPDYGYQESNKVIGNYPVLQKAINVDGNMSINAETNITGNILVKGNGENNLMADNKYKGGITINQSKVAFTGEVATSNTFNIQSNTNVAIYGNLYAGNVYAGDANDISKTINGDSDSSSLSIDNQMIVDNDLAIKANNTTISMKDFYGINDKNVKSETTSAKARTSSSIIVNANKKSSVTVSDYAYIMGVAYIDVGDGYQTGESVAVKGNYLAYATPLVESDNFAKCQFGKVGSLQLVQNLDALQKSNYFKEFSDKYISQINDGGINLNKDKTYSVGAIVYKNSENKPVVQASNYLIDTGEKTITGKRVEYASKVYKMGQLASTSIYDALGQISDTVNSTITLNGDYDIESQKDVSEKAIFNSDVSKTIVIKGTNPTGIYDSKYIVLDGENLNAVIATAGSVIIDGKVNFKGNILAEGNLDIKGTGTKTIAYDEDLCNRIQSANIELFKRVFGTPVSTEGGLSGSNENKIAIRYDIKKYLKSTLWTIIK